MDRLPPRLRDSAPPGMAGGPASAPTKRPRGQRALPVPTEQAGAARGHRSPPPRGQRAANQNHGTSGGCFYPWEGKIPGFGLFLPSSQGSWRCTDGSAAAAEAVFSGFRSRTPSSSIFACRTALFPRYSTPGSCCFHLPSCEPSGKELRQPS